ncbi:MAG: coiled-coil domain-containing protein [Caldisericum sp.]|uniref:coiled-coil domain-containing protein n=1 Tax=Caldisericum sp. TaxID=2499687 RepID=UPI003D0F0ED3
MFEEIIHPLKELWKKVTHGADTNDLRRIFYGDTKLINKFLTDERYQQNVLSLVEELQRKEPNINHKGYFLYGLYTHLRTHQSFKQILNETLLTKPEIKNFNYLATLARLGRFTTNPQQMQKVEELKRRGIDPDVFYILNELQLLDVINEKDLKDEKKLAYLANNWQQTIAGYLKWRTTTEALEKVGQTLDFLSMGLFLGGVGGLGIKMFLSTIGKEVLKKTWYKAIISKAFRFSDLSFLGGTGLHLLTDVKFKNQIPSVWDIVLTGLAVTPYVPVAKKVVRKGGEAVFKKTFGPPTIEDLRMHINLSEPFAIDLPQPTREALGAFQKVIEDRAGVWEKGVSVKKVQPFLSMLPEAFAQIYTENKALKLANLYVNPTENSVKYFAKRGVLQQFLEANLDNIVKVYKNLEKPLELVGIFDKNHDLLEFFTMNASRYFNFSLHKLMHKIDVEDLPKVGAKLENLLIHLGPEFEEYAKAKGLPYSMLSLEEVLHQPEVMTGIENFIRHQISEGRVSLPFQWFLKTEEGLKEIEKIGNLRLPNNLWLVYIPTSDFTQVFRVAVKTLTPEVGEEVKIKSFYMPNELVNQIGKKAKNTEDFYQKIKDYIAKSLGISSNDVEIIERFKYPMSVIPTKPAFSKIFGDVFDSVKEAEKKLERVDNYLATITEQSSLIKQAEQKLKEIRSELMDLAKEAELKTKNVKTEVLIKRLEELGKIDADKAEQLKAIIKELQLTKKTEILLDSGWIKTIANVLEKEVPKSPTSSEVYKQWKTWMDEMPWEQPRLTTWGFLKLTEYVDKKDLLEYLTKSYMRNFAYEERQLFGVLNFFDEYILQNYKDTALAKTLQLIRDYQQPLKGEGFTRAKWLSILGKASRLFTYFNPKISMGAFIQAQTAIKTLFPSYELLGSQFDFFKAMINSPAFRREVIRKISLARLPNDWLPAGYSFFEGISKSIISQQLIKNPKFNQEVARFLRLERIPLESVDEVASILAGLIDNPASLSQLAAGSKLGQTLAVLQSWYPFVVAPFQIAMTSWFNMLKGPQRLRYLMNSFYLTLLGTIFLPSTISPLVAPIETIRKLYQDFVSPVIGFTMSALTGEPREFDTWLEERDDTVKLLIKNLFANLTGLPKEKFMGRLAWDTGIWLTLHADEHQASYINIGLQKLLDFVKRLDLEEKGLVSPGAVSTSFDFAFPVWRSVWQFLRAFAVGQEEKVFVKEVVNTLTQMIPVWRNLKQGLIRTLTAYGPQKDLTTDKVLGEFLSNLVDRKEVGWLTWLSYMTGVLISHPLTIPKMFDLMFSGSFIENAKMYGEELIKGDPKMIAYIYLPRVRNTKDYEERVMGKEDFIIESIYRAENRETIVNAFQTYANVLKSLASEQKKKEIDLEKHRKLLRSFNVLLSEAYLAIPELREIFSHDYNEIIESLAEKYGKENVLEWIKQDLDETQLRRKLFDKY